jgi:DNA replication protein DnaC
LIFWHAVKAGTVDSYEWLYQIFNRRHIDLDINYADYVDAIHMDFDLPEDCPLCRGAGAFVGANHAVYCFCSLLRRRDELAYAERPESVWEKKTLAALDRKFNPGMGSVVQRMVRFIQYPDTWLVLSGQTGTGKSHILQAIMSWWSPWFLYVTANDLERWLRVGLNDEARSVQWVMDALQTTPGLIIDDLGIEYSTPWIRQKLEDLIEYRGRDVHWFDKITVFGTNIRQSEIIARFVGPGGVSRIGSRLSENPGRVEWLAVTGNDYRRKNATK